MDYPGLRCAVFKAWDRNQGALAPRQASPYINPERRMLWDNQTLDNARLATKQIRSTLAGTEVHIALRSHLLANLLEHKRMYNAFADRSTGSDPHAETDLPSLDSRKEVESHHFGIPPEAGHDVRPIYGFLHHPDTVGTWSSDEEESHTGKAIPPKIARYGNVIARLRSSVHPRTTVTLGDSFHTEVPTPLSRPSFTAVPPEHLGAYHHIEDATHTHIPYVEAQVHGGVSLADIEHLHITNPSEWGPQERNTLQDVFKQHGITTSFPSNWQPPKYDRDFGSHRPFERFRTLDKSKVSRTPWLQTLDEFSHPPEVKAAEGHRLLYHITDAKNLASIRRHGLDPSRANAEADEPDTIWAHTDPNGYSRGGNLVTFQVPHDDPLVHDHGSAGVRIKRPVAARDILHIDPVPPLIPISSGVGTRQSFYQGRYADQYHEGFMEYAKQQGLRTRKSYAALRRAVFGSHP